MATRSSPRLVAKRRLQAEETRILAEEARILAQAHRRLKRETEMARLQAEETSLQAEETRLQKEKLLLQAKRIQVIGCGYADLSVETRAKITFTRVICDKRRDAFEEYKKANPEKKYPHLTFSAIYKRDHNDEWEAYKSEFMMVEARVQAAMEALRKQ